MADFDHAAESGQCLFVDLLVGEKFRIIEKIPQKPAQLPHRFLRAVETPHDGLPGQDVGFENGEPEDVEGFVGVPAELGAIDANEEDSVGNLRARIAGGFGKARGLGVSCDHLLLRARVAVELADQGVAVPFGPVSQFLDEVLDLLAGGFSESLRAAEVDGVGFNQFRIKLVLLVKN